MNRTLYDKIWDAHLVGERSDGNSLIYIDLQLLHEVTSPQAFEGLSLANRKLWRKDANLATPDHNVPTNNRDLGLKGISDPIALEQVTTLNENCALFDVEQFDILDQRQGIVHVVGPEQGATLPGMTIVCGDSHTSTHGAFGALAQGIGTSEVEHVMATQCLVQQKAKNFDVSLGGELTDGVFAKDLIMAVIGELGTAGATGHTIEFNGSAVRSLTMESRMTLCNMAIEAGARAGLVAVDGITLDYVNGRPFAPKGELWEEAAAYWETLVTDGGAVFDSKIEIDASGISPQVSWGTSPEMVVDFDGNIPDPELVSEDKKKNIQLAKQYMGIEADEKLTDLKFDKVFIGSCTNSRIEDLREAASIVEGKQVADTIIEAIVVPGSGMEKLQAEAEGLDKILEDAGFIWRDPGCSMCLGMNPDQLKPYERCASTSNRNFEGRQGNLGRTHLMSPMMAALTAINGTVSNPS